MKPARKHRVLMLCLAVLSCVVIVAGCDAPTESPAPSAELSPVTVEPSSTPTPSPTPRVLLEIGACGEYEVFPPPDSLEVCVSMNEAEAEYTFDLTGVETPDKPRRLSSFAAVEPLEDGSDTIYSLYCLDSSFTTNDVDMQYSVLVSDDDHIAFIDDLLASAEFQPIPEEDIEFENRLCLYAETESGFVEYHIGTDGLLLRLSEPYLRAESEIEYEAAEVDPEAAAYLHAIEWANRSLPTRHHNDWKCSDNLEPADYRMCIVGEQLHLHLTVDEAKEFVETFDPDSPVIRDTLSFSELGWDGYDGYIIVDEYVNKNGDAEQARRHVLFRDGSIAARLTTHSAVMHFAGANSTIISYDANFPRAVDLSDAEAVDYSAALAWIDDYLAE